MVLSDRGISVKHLGIRRLANIREDKQLNALGVISTILDHSDLFIPSIRLVRL